jgi:PAS domain S-box-containing protein
MVDFYRRAMKKLEKLDSEQRGELLISAVEKIGLLENVLNSIDVGILVCDENNNLVLVNKCAKRMLPLNYNEGVEIWTAIEDQKIVEFFKSILLDRERVVDREIDVVSYGRSKLLSVNVVPLVDDRKITGSLIYMNDITEKRKVESRLRRAENLASLTTLAAGVAHEIKNPLGSISIHMQLLQKVLSKNIDIEKSTNKYFDVIKEEVDRLNRIVVDFLFAVRPMTLELREGDINKLVLHLVEFVTLEMEQSGIKCNLELDENLPKILMDERYMKQALLNLITNARTAMPKGGSLSITTNFADNEIKISISDTGMGITEENIAKIFEPYFTTTETGTGLGLTHVYKIIREHHGEVAVHSTHGEGTCFEVILHVPQKETKMITYTTEGVVK